MAKKFQMTIKIEGFKVFILNSQDADWLDFLIEHPSHNYEMDYAIIDMARSIGWQIEKISDSQFSTFLKFSR